MKAFRVKSTGVGEKTLFVFGVPLLRLVSRRKVLREILRRQQWQIDSQLLAKQGIGLSRDTLSVWNGAFEIDEVPVGDLKRMTSRGPIPLKDGLLIRYLKSGDGADMDAYYEFAVSEGWLPKRQDPAQREKDRASFVAYHRGVFEKLGEREYDPSLFCIAVSQNNVIVDGYHRSSYLCHKYGPDHRVKVVRILVLL